MSVGKPVTGAEVAQALEFARARFAAFEERVSAMLASDRPADYEFKLARALLAAKRIIGATAAFDRIEPASKKPPRGLGYGRTVNGTLTPDDAMIVASLPWYGDNLSAAVRAHYPEANPQEVQVHARRIREERKKIEQAEGILEWETSNNWLGDLIAE
jgi:hypothetical protein